MSKTHLVPTGTMAAIAELLPKGAVTTAYHDPMDILEDTLNLQAGLYSRVLTSMAWMVDTACINQARNILFTRYSEQEVENGCAPVNFKDFCQQISEDLDHPSLYEFEGNERTLAQLIALALQWHDAADKATAADDKDYKPKTLREQMESEKVRPADIGTRTNHKKVAELEAHGDAAKAERLYAAYMEADDLASAARVESNRALIPTVLEILRTANRYADASTRFDQLPSNKQKQLATFAVGAVARSRGDMVKVLKRQPIAFGHLAEAALQATEQLNKLIEQRYSDTGDLENVRTQVSIDHERNQKRAAICRFD